MPRQTEACWFGDLCQKTNCSYFHSSYKHRGDAPIRTQGDGDVRHHTNYTATDNSHRSHTPGRVYSRGGDIHQPADYHRSHTPGRAYSRGDDIHQPADYHRSHTPGRAYSRGDDIHQPADYTTNHHRSQGLSHDNGEYIDTTDDVNKLSQTPFTER